MRLLNRIRKAAILCLILMISVNSLVAQKAHSDNGDGTYTNPVIAADFPDPNVSLAGDT